MTDAAKVQDEARKLLDGLIGKRIHLSESITAVRPVHGSHATYSQFSMIVDGVVEPEPGIGLSLTGKDGSEYMINAANLVSIDYDPGNAITIVEHYEESTERRTTIELPGIDFRKQVTRSFRDEE